ncbi:oxidoreductase-like protein [Macroventuria anomochaeta]|uniref:Oxidoreductase-like protein n=1 Tax=Macroventuria anomochaeta TaxID=301207 RepID=A0ACB6SK29_9PLEO|nr:oxidoreductase-like protein [Macroventuria anomochaeta]KAF2633998.1 oxidoreductase-like protein [Macroventuria anomochaeta]
MAFSMALGWSEGEEKMHKLLHVPNQDNPTATMLTQQASFMLQRAPLLAIGTLDDQSRPWTALWGGASGFSEPIGGGFVGTRTLVDGKYDPVVQALVGGTEKGEMLQPKGKGKMIAGLAIDLVTRKRVKIAGRMAAGSVQEVDMETEDNAALPADALGAQDQIQLVTKIEQSMGNCPKYVNQYEIKPALITPKLISEGPSLSPDGRALVDKADMFFLTTAASSDMDTNHRGGPPGFVRVISPTCIIYPEYSGNRLYQSLGNLQLNPLIGITFPDYETGDVLYTTGTAEVLVGADAAQMMPGTNLAVKINLTSTRFVASGLAFRGELKLNGHSPYNPLLRILASEGNIKSLIPPSSPKTARLVKRTLLTPTIARFTFEIAGGVSYKAGQWVAFDFKQDLDIGYSHMRNDDPRSLNDDFVRTFTISSAPTGVEKEFDITIRKVGPVTEYLFQQNERAGFEVPILGIGGEFKIAQKEEGGGVTPFVAGGVGITPLLGQLANLDLSSERFKLLWTVKATDVGLVVDTLSRYPQLAKGTEVFVTGKAREIDEKKMKKVTDFGAKVELRRLAKADLDGVEADRWYLCAGKPFRKQVLSWLPGREVIFEDFDY